MAKSWIEKWTDNVNRTNYDIQSWALGMNDDDASFWGRNKTKLFTPIMFGALTFIGWLVKWELMFRVCGIILILYILSNVLNLLKELWKKLMMKMKS